MQHTSSIPEIAHLSHFTHLFNLADLMEVMPENPSLQQELIEDLLRNIPRYLARIEESLQAADPHALSHAAFNLRGVSATFAMHRVPQICQTLEQAAALGNFVMAQRHYEHLASQLQPLLDYQKQRLCAHTTVDHPSVLAITH